jgi:hypothetical protein
MRRPRWTCDCQPITATGLFRSGRWLFVLHGPGCDRPLLRRQTLVVRSPR